MGAGFVSSINPHSISIQRASFRGLVPRAKPSRSSCRCVTTMPAAKSSCASRWPCSKSLGPCSTSRSIARTARPSAWSASIATLCAQLINSPENVHNRVGVRIHDPAHPHWREDIDILVAAAGARLAYVVVPKVTDVVEVARVTDHVNHVARSAGIARHIPIHVLIETHAALEQVFDIAALVQVECLSFGLMDFVSAPPRRHSGRCDAFTGPVRISTDPPRHAGDLGGLPPPRQGAVAQRQHRRAASAARRRRRQPRPCRVRLPAQVEHPSGPDRPDRGPLSGPPTPRSAQPARSCWRPTRTTGRRSAITANCTTAPATATTGRCCNAPTPRAPASPAAAAELFFD